MSNTHGACCMTHARRYGAGIKNPRARHFPFRESQRHEYVCSLMLRQSVGLCPPGSLSDVFTVIFDAALCHITLQAKSAARPAPGPGERQSQRVCANQCGYNTARERQQRRLTRNLT
jgi:hypothetical protein